MPDLTRRFHASELLEPAALALLLEVHGRAEGGECDATTTELAEAIGVSPRHAVRLIRSLERGGWIVTTWSRSGRWIALAPGVEAVEGEPGGPEGR